MEYTIYMIDFTNVTPIRLQYNDSGYVAHLIRYLDEELELDLPEDCMVMCLDALEKYLNTSEVVEYVLLIEDRNGEVVLNAGWVVN